MAISGFELLTKEDRENAKELLKKYKNYGMSLPEAVKDELCVLQLYPRQPKSIYGHIKVADCEILAEWEYSAGNVIRAKNMMMEAIGYKKPVKRESKLVAMVARRPLPDGTC